MTNRTMRGQVAVAGVGETAYYRRGIVMFEHGLDRCADAYRLARIAQEIAQHAHAPGVRQLDHDDDIRTGVPEGRVYRMPGASPAIDHALRLHSHRIHHLRFYNGGSQRVAEAHSKMSREIAINQDFTTRL